MDKLHLHGVKHGKSFITLGPEFQTGQLHSQAVRILIGWSLLKPADPDLQFSKQLYNTCLAGQRLQILIL